ncbi:Uncharacterized protein OBRU01_01329 [Operophtera brumata]|uniref:Fibrous sheath-interacting protein 2 n=1 Tax=Operophtera brumata TaxID=104452 RepID=A0A0L7LTG4_OPEBR|nr:Uncharacterized protein OBRU01_01329 [Operophtera brumata]
MSDESEINEQNDVDTILMTLRKPTELKKVIDSIPKPLGAVPKNGLPNWYRLGLECKLPVPKMPEGKIIFSRGKIGEDVRRIGLGSSGPQPTFDLSDPYCNNVSYDYVPMHDPHLTHFFAQKPARKRMKSLGFCTVDGRAQCSLKEFNQYRKFLYNLEHLFYCKLQDERARDDLTLMRVERDVARRLLVFVRVERAREQLERVTKEHADEWAEKRRLAREQEKKVVARMKYLAEYNEQQRYERTLRAREKQNRIKQRVQAAAEIELKRKIIMIRQWRINEKKRMNRVKQDREAKQKSKEDDAKNKWVLRVSAQSQKIQEEALLLKLYTDDMSAGAMRRANAVSTQGDALMTLGQARTKMDMETTLPSAPVKLLDEILESVVVEFARTHVHHLLLDIERNVIAFGSTTKIASEEFTEVDMKRAKDRLPTPVPSKTKLAEVTFVDKIEDLTDPVTLAAKFMSRSVSLRVYRGLDIIVGQVTLPRMRHPMDWGEAVEGLADAVVNNRVNTECADMRRASDYSPRFLNALHAHKVLLVYLQM